MPQPARWDHCSSRLWKTSKRTKGGLLISRNDGLFLQLPICALVAVPNEDQAVHIMTVYGYSNAVRNGAAMRANEELLAAVLRVSTELGEVPILLLGDLNVHNTEWLYFLTIIYRRYRYYI